MEVFGIFLSFFTTHLCKHDSIPTNCQSTIMLSVTPQHSDGNHPRPHLINSAHDDIIWRLAYLPDGRRVATGSSDGTVKVWNLENGEQEGTSIEHESQICGLAVTRDGTNIVSVDGDGKIKVWDVKSHEIVKEWTHPESWPEISISPDDRHIAVGAWTVAIYTMEGGQVIHSIEVGSRLSSLCFSPNGKKLARSTRDDIRVYDVDSGALFLQVGLSQSNWIRDVLWSRDGSRLFSGSDDETISCWNSDTGERIGHPWTGHKGSIRSLSISPDGSILASASFDQTVRFWNATTGNPAKQQLQHDEQVNAVRFSPSGESVASAGWDGKTYLWRLNSIKDLVITHFTCVPALVLLTLLQASSSLPGTKNVPRNFQPSLYASIFSIARPRLLDYSSL
jgi:WD40 repeat protein